VFSYDETANVVTAGPAPQIVNNAFEARRSACFYTYWLEFGTARHFGIWHPKWDAAEGYGAGVCEWQRTVENRGACQNYMIDSWGVGTFELARQFCGYRSEATIDGNPGGCFPNPADPTRLNYCRNL